MENAVQYSVPINELISMYRSLRIRTKKRIGEAFNKNFHYGDDNSVMARLFDKRLSFNYDEYEFLCPIIVLNYEFEQWAKPQYLDL
ncbi:hypothetical protein DTQ70_09085 [Runella sp. SP2]|nr:hypothetical protein DTQ70_09085 [Runella sp. SP2]